MSTATAERTDAAVVDLTDTVPDAPRKRGPGRPKGSKNKPKDGMPTPRKRTTARKRTTPAPTPVKAADKAPHAVLIENDGTVTKFTFIDNTGAETLVQAIPNEGLILDRR